MKNQDPSEQLAKSRLAVQVFMDRLHGHFTHSPTVQRSAQRLLLALTPKMPIVQPISKLVDRDITKVYNHSATAVSSQVFLELPEKFGLLPRYIIMLSSRFMDCPRLACIGFIRITSFTPRICTWNQLILTCVSYLRLV